MILILSKSKNNKEPTVVPTDARGPGTTTAHVATEAHTERAATPEDPMEVRDEQADTVDAPTVASG